MVFVDFSRADLRRTLAGHAARHAARLAEVRAQLPALAAASREAEQRAGGRARPLAAVVDIDEVILANIHMNSFSAPATADGPAIDFHASDFFTGPDGRPWPRGEHRLNPLMPGAWQLLADLSAAGLRVVLLSGRAESLRAETLENFALVGLTGAGGPLDPAALAAGDLILCPDAELPRGGGSIAPFKRARRLALEASHRIALNIGDQESDLGGAGDAHILLSHPFYATP